MTFQSTLPLRGATYSYWISPSVQIFQSTLPLRGATIGGFQHFVPAEISIHTPLAGSDLVERVPSALILEFQSTLPLRGATFSMRLVQHIVSISIHTPLAGSDVVDVRHVYPVLISIHTPLAGSDDALPQLVDCLQISIHTPLAGSDMPLFFLPLVVSYFNPHSPCGERRSSGSLGFGYRSKFQSTLPLRGATARRTRWCSRNRNFNPHSPCGERPALTVPRWCFSKFQSTLPLRGATQDIVGKRVMQ